MNCPRSHALGHPESVFRYRGVAFLGTAMLVHVARFSAERRYTFPPLRVKT